ncbi:MAG: twin-arginine translocation signal domain-containing protein [Phycisphaerales bacterium]|nr:twin-arginine translocation signal domain-containing protein [Phycisphaerales bacterium]
MNTPPLTNISRRQFVALSTAAAATATISPNTLASTTPTSSHLPAAALPAPSLAAVLPNPTNPTTKRLRCCPNPSPSPRARISNPTLTITPLSCISSRLARNASLTIEAFHPVPNLYTTLLHAHNKDIPGTALPDFASTTVTKAPRDSKARTTLRITQQHSSSTQHSTITLDSSQPATYLLAVPTAHHASNAAWRLTTAHSNDTHEITHLTNPLRAASTHCVYLSIIITYNPGE